MATLSFSFFTQLFALVKEQGIILLGLEKHKRRNEWPTLENVLVGM